MYTKRHFAQTDYYSTLTFLNDVIHFAKEGMSRSPIPSPASKATGWEKLRLLEQFGCQTYALRFMVL